MFERIEETAKFISEKLEGRTPKLGIILGSGLGVFADQAQDKIEIPYNEIPNFHPTTVVGHKGRLVVGKIEGIEVCIMQGRFHTYEGHSLEDVVLPVRVLAQIGIENLILTNAAGGINPQYVPGDLVCITDHLNLTGRNPLVGPNDDRIGPRFPDMTEAYHSGLNEKLALSAQELGFELKTGIYAGLLGPTYETPAEIRMLSVLGADMVGMSTVPESIAANHAGLKVCGISCITNLAAGISKEKLNHDEVKEVANLSMERFTNLLSLAVKNIG
jgi:purine-nucleoside phosphorylase